jgi:hypothetical protein
MTRSTFSFVRGRCGPGALVLDRAGGEELAQGTVVWVAPGVVRHQALWLDPVRGEEGQSALQEAGTSRGLRVAKHLGVGEPGVVVHDRVHDVGAERAPPLLRRARAVAGDRVPRLREAGERRPVSAEEVARAGPLVATSGLAGRGPCPRRRRSSQIRSCLSAESIASCSSAESIAGERQGLLERSQRQASVRRPPRSLPASNATTCRQWPARRHGVSPPPSPNNPPRSPRPARADRQVRASRYGAAPSGPPFEPWSSRDAQPRKSQTFPSVVQNVWRSVT